MWKIKRINHIAMVVEDIEAALHFWQDVLGLRLHHMEDIPDQQAVIAFLPVGDSEVELVKPTNESSGIARYLQRKGPGIHHLCFEVSDIHSALQQLKEKNIRLINETPLIGTDGKTIAFIHPESTHGVLIELVESTHLEPSIRLERAHTFSKRLFTKGQVIMAGALAFLRALRSNGKDTIEKP